MSVTIVETPTETSRNQSDYYQGKKYEKPLSPQQRSKNGGHSRSLSTGGKSAQEVYYFAKSVRSSNKIQVQRIHLNSHPEPIFNVTAKLVSRKTCRVKQLISLEDDISESYPEKSVLSDSIVLYDGSCAPLSTQDSYTRIYTVQPYDSTSSDSHGFLQFSKYGIFFNPKSTPLVLPDSTIRSQQRNSIDNSSLSILDPFFYQPIAWFVVPVYSSSNRAETPSTFKIVDQSTNHVLGKWVKKTTTTNNEIIWVFSIRGEILARFQNGQLIISSSSNKHKTYVDQEIKTVRSKLFTKGKNYAINLPKTSIRNSITSIARSHSTNAIISSNFIASEYRPRQIDGLLFSYLAVQLYHNDIKFTTTTGDNINNKKKKHSTSSTASSNSICYSSPSNSASISPTSALNLDNNNCVKSSVVSNNNSGEQQPQPAAHKRRFSTFIKSIFKPASPT